MTRTRNYLLNGRGLNKSAWGCTAVMPCYASNERGVRERGKSKLKTPTLKESTLPAQTSTKATYITFLHAVSILKSYFVCH